MTDTVSKMRSVGDKDARSRRAEIGDNGSGVSLAASFRERTGLGDR